MISTAPAVPSGRCLTKSAQKRTKRRRPVDSKYRRFAMSSADEALSLMTLGSVSTTYEYLIRGSNTTYTRSTTKFTRTNTAASSSTSAWISG